MGRTLDYDEVDTLSKHFASYLLNELKLNKGDRVAIMLPNVLQYPIALFGMLRAGLDGRQHESVVHRARTCAISFTIPARARSSCSTISRRCSQKFCAIRR